MSSGPWHQCQGSCPLYIMEQTIETIIDTHVQGRKAKTFLLETSKKAFFLTSMPFYWFFIFKYILEWFDWQWFLFVVACSFLLSLYTKGWGIGLIS